MLAEPEPGLRPVDSAKHCVRNSNEPSPSNARLAVFDVMMSPSGSLTLTAVYSLGPYRSWSTWPYNRLYVDVKHKEPISFICVGRLTVRRRRLRATCQPGAPDLCIVVGVLLIHRRSRDTVKAASPTV
jgi:hypothetical protein